MKNKTIKSIFLATIAAVFLAFTPLTVVAEQCSEAICGNDNYPASVQAACGCGGNASDDLPGVVTNILERIVQVSSLVAVAFIIIGGIQYMTSAGDTTKTQKAKNTILYASIGLIICVLSFAIINFTVNNILNGDSSGDSSQQSSGKKSNNNKSDKDNSKDTDNNQDEASDDDE